MWIGTANGLNRYDGSAFKVFKNRRYAEDELAGNDVTRIKEDHEGGVWIATVNGLSFYDQATGNIHTWRINTADQNINLIKDFIIKDQCLWGATYNGLVKFDIKKKSFRRFENLYYPKGTSRGALNKMNQLLDLGDGKLLLGTFNGLWIFDTAKEKFEPLYIDPVGIKTVVNTLYIDHNRNIWVIFYGGSLCLYDMASKQMRSSFQNLSLPSGFFITEYPGKNNYVLNADHYLIDLNKNTVTDLLESDKVLADNLLINTSYYSTDNLLWLGTDKGILIFDLDQSAFSTHILGDQKLSHQGVAALYKNSNIYIGAANQNFFREYDSSFHLLKNISFPRSMFNVPNAALMNIVPEGEDELWLCTENGIGLYNINKGPVRWYRPNFADSTEPAKNFFTNLFIDSKGNHWVFPWRSGIWMLDKQSGKFSLKCKGFTIQNNELKKLVVTDAVEDGAGNIWFADIDEGIIKYDAAKQFFSRITDLQPSLVYSASVLEFKKPFLWTITGGSITSFNTITNEMKQWPIPEELSSSVAGFCVDDTGNCWITTKKGLLFFNRRLNQFKKYTTADGLADNDLDDEIRNLGNGELLFAKNNYVTVFSPDKVRSKTFRLLFTEILSQDKELNWQTNDKGEKEIILDHTYSNFVFKWGLLNFRNPLQNLYYCKLEGIDADWKYVGNHGDASYASLNPGKYVFRIKANASNATGPVEDFITIIIRPPFWKSWWFILLASVTLLSLLVFIVQYISTRNLKEKLLRLEKEQAIEKERNRIARDMHDDLGSGLTKIAILSEVAKTQLLQPDKARAQLENISESSRELVDSMQDIIWVLNPKNDTLESLASYIREYALKFFEPFETGIRFNYPEVIPAVKLTEEQRRNIFLVIKESFNNIAKHAWCNTVTVSLEKINGRIILNIEDDGKGFNINDTREFGNGLQNMRTRMQQVDGLYEISSIPGKGTHTKMSIPV